MKNRVVSWSPGTRFFCIGIGGIGMSALAVWLTKKGMKVCGTDRMPSSLVERIVKEGIDVVVKADGMVVPKELDVVVYSDAVSEEDPGRVSARARNIPQYSYAEAVGVLAQEYETIALAGSHGKSTTTALASLLLREAQKDPTALIGTLVPGLGDTNMRIGKGKLFVVEADEYKNHCLEFFPHVTAITSVDHDHVDAFPTMEDYIAVFATLIDHTVEDGVVVLNKEDTTTQVFTERAGRRHVVHVGIDIQPTDGVDTVSATARIYRDGMQHFTILRNGKVWAECALPLPGKHLVFDALAALASTMPYGVLPVHAQNVFQHFAGTWRRFEKLGTWNTIPVFSDYAHHPTELRALLAAAREGFPDKRIVCAFQPHQRSRTRAFAAAFPEALIGADVIVLPDVFDVLGREEEERISTADWVGPLRAGGKEALYVGVLENVIPRLRDILRPGDVLFFVGAGNIDTVAREFMQQV